MARRDWLIVTLFDQHAAASVTLDPVRIQKAMFYVSKSGSVPAKETYDFRPYYYGPFSAAIYRDIDSLVSEGLVDAIPVAGQGWSRYCLSGEGVEAATTLIHDAPPDGLVACQAAQEKVITNSFRGLLREVYEKYPEMATESVIKKQP